MNGKQIRAAIVGASTLLGKELAEELNNSSSAVWDLKLLDADDAGGAITSAGDEALVVQPLSQDSFTGVDVVFFAGESSTTSEYWTAAHSAGASVVDLTGALEGQPQTLVRSPLVEGGVRPDLMTAAEIVAHPAALMLAAAATGLVPLGLKRIAATVLQPASQAGSAGVDEVHQQTVGLLSFQPLKKDVYDAQIAFNLAASLGDAARMSLTHTSQLILRQIDALLPGLPQGAFTVQLLQAPVFHGYTTSIFIELNGDFDVERIRTSLVSEPSILQSDDAPSNESAAGQGNVLLRIASAGAPGTFWLWMAADNLRLFARNAAACALELLSLKPARSVQ